MNSVSEVSITICRLLDMETEITSKINNTIEEVFRVYSNSKKEKELIKNLMSSIQYSLENAERYIEHIKQGDI